METRPHPYVATDRSPSSAVTVGSVRRLTVGTGADTVVARRQGDYNTFFPDAVRAADGRVAVVFYSSRQHMHTPDSRIQLTWGTSDGEDWTEPRTIIDVAGFDDRDPSITQLSSGRLVVNWFRRDPEDLTSTEHGVMCSYSDDLGATWLPEVRIGSALARAAVTAPPLELADGTLLMPLYGFREQESTQYELRIAVSRDHGESWAPEDEIVPIPPLVDGVGLVEPTLASLGGGGLLMVARSRNHPENLAYALWSEDSGQTWSTATLCDFAGHAPHLLAVGEPTAGVAPLLMTWGEYAASDESTRPVHARLVNGHDRSLDGSTVVLYENPATRDMSYPSTAALDASTFLTVYYDAAAGHIAGTRTTMSEI